MSGTTTVPSTPQPPPDVVPVDLPLPATSTPERARDLFWSIAAHGIGAAPDAVAKTRALYDALAAQRLTIPARLLQYFEATATIAFDRQCISVGPGMHGPDVALLAARDAQACGAATTFDLSGLRAAGPAEAGPLAAWRRMDAAAPGASVYVRADHPDIGDLIRASGDLQARLVIGVTDNLLDALARGADYDLVEPTTGASAGTRRARVTLERITERMWAGDGLALVFIDRLLDADPRGARGVRLIPQGIGGHPLAPDEATRALELDLSRHLVQHASGWRLDDAALASSVAAATAWLPPPGGRIMPELRIVGVARAAFLQGVPYADERTRAELVRALRIVRETLDGNDAGHVRISTPHLRPLASLAHMRAPGAAPAIAKELVQAARVAGFWHEGLPEALAAANGSARNLPGVPAHWRSVFAVGAEVAPAGQLLMQVAADGQTGGANMGSVIVPAHTQPAEVADLVRDAATLGCHGLAVMRHDQLGHRAMRTATQEERARTPRPRPEILRSTTHKLEPACGTIYVTVGADESGPVEVITVRARGNACNAANLEATSRLAGLALRSGIGVEQVAQALRGVRCGEPVITPTATILGCVDAIGQALERHVLGPGGPQHEVFHEKRLDDFSTGQ